MPPKVTLDTLVMFYGFDSSSTFPLSNGTWFVKNVNFAVNNSSSVHVNNRKKDMVVLGKDPTDELDNTAM